MTRIEQLEHLIAWFIKEYDDGTIDESVSRRMIEALSLEYMKEVSR